MGFEKLKEEALQGNKKNIILFGVITGIAFILMIVFWSLVNGSKNVFLTILLVLLSLVFTAITALAAFILVKAIIAYSKNKNKDPEQFKPKPQVQHKSFEEQQRENEEFRARIWMLQSFDEHNNLKEGPFEMLVHEIAGEFTDKHVCNLKLELLPVRDYMTNDSITLNVVVRGDEVYCRSLQSDPRDVAGQCIKAMDRIKDKYGEKLGDVICDDIGLTSEFIQAMEDDAIHNMLDAKKGIKKLLLANIIPSIDQLVRKFGIVYNDGVVIKKTTVKWDIMLSSSQQYQFGSEYHKIDKKTRR